MTLTPHPSRRQAFTIIELMVAMAIASIMVFLINRIFFDTTNAISRGIGLSQIIGEARAVSNTLDKDLSVNNITQPGTDGGFIFIAYHQFPNVDFPSPRRMGTTQVRTVQSDQMLIHVKGLGVRTPLTPRDSTTLAPYVSATPQDNGLLWYGHVARLSADGTDGGGMFSGLNRFGNNWIVGRQLTFPDPDVASATPAAAYINGLLATSQTQNYPGTPARYMAMSDVSSASMPTLITELNTLSASSTDIGLAARIAYLTITGSDNHRLRVAPHVTHDQSNPGSPANPTLSFLSRNVAQTHTAFINNCSDFQIAFTGDFDHDDEIDTDASGNIKWYGFPVNMPGEPGYNADLPHLYNPVTLPGSVFNTGGVEAPVCLDYANLLAAVKTMDGTLGIINDIEAQQGVMFRPLTTPANLRYHWPHMIRIRYRLHDERGEVESNTGMGREQGIWFEQIIRIQ